MKKVSFVLILFLLLIVFSQSSFFLNTDNSKKHDININTNNSVEDNVNVNNLNTDNLNTNNIPSSNNYSINCRLFFVNKNDGKQYYFDKKLQITDNNLAYALVEELKHNRKNYSFINILDDVNINDINFDYDNDLIKLNFDYNFINKMNLDEDVKDSFILTIANTLCYNYNLKNISIKFNDKNYNDSELYLSLDTTSSHLYKNDSDLDVKYENKSENNTHSSDDKLSTYRAFYYDSFEDKIFYFDKSFNSEENELHLILLKSLKNNNNPNYLTLPSNVSIDNISVQDDILSINISQNFYDILNSIGGSGELNLLNSIALTYGYNYNVSKVKILVNNAPYSSGHLLFEEDEYINIESIDSYSIS